MLQPRFWSEDDKLLKQQLSIGHYYEDLAADRIRGEGFKALTSSREFRKTIADSHMYADQADVRVLTQAGVRKVEVKSRKLYFTSTRDYPYPTMMVISKNSWDQMKVKPWAIIIVSQRTHTMLVTPGIHYKTWWVEKHFDYTRGIWDNFYMCRMDLVFPWETFIRALQRDGEKQAA